MNDQHFGNEVENRELLRQQTVLAKFGQFALKSDNLDEILTEACSLVGEAPCAIFDVSNAGARIQLFTTAEIPETVTLRLTDGTARGALRCWQRGAQVGFKFAAAAAN